MFILMISIFVLGIAMISLEDKVGINKSAIALFMAVVLWMLVPQSVSSNSNLSSLFLGHLGEISQTIFFVMGALVIIELVDAHGGFRVVAKLIRTKKKRKLLFIISLLTFTLSALLGNIATGVMMIALLRKLIPTKEDRIIFACMVILAANAGGSFSPIGDVAAILLWTGGNLTPIHQITQLFFPALVSLMVPLILVCLYFKKEQRLKPSENVVKENVKRLDVGSRSRFIILVIGVSTMIMVPIFSETTHLPPFMMIIAGMSLLWIYTDIMYGRLEGIDEKSRMPIGKILTSLDISTLMFFLGILMSVAALNVSGQLSVLSQFLSENFKRPEQIVLTIGVLSSFIDNVALVAAAKGMYPLHEATSIAFMPDGIFWTFLAYCSIAGGNLLIIGSATGVTIMGLEKISFMYYLKKFTVLALFGYVAGAATYLLIALT